MSSRKRLSTFIPAGLIVESTTESGETVFVRARAQADEQACPLCGKRSSRIHSRYVRTAADLPCAGRKVVLQLVARRFVCATPPCKIIKCESEPLFHADTHRPDCRSLPPA